MNKFLPSLLTIILACSCAESTISEIDSNYTNNDENTLYTYIESSSVRTFIENGTSLCWHKGDEVSYFPASNTNMKYIFSGEDGDKSGILTKVEGNYTSGSPLECNYALYPYDASATIKNNAILCTLPQQQSYANNSFGKGANLMVAATESSTKSSINFKNVCGFIKLQFYGSDITVQSIEFKGNNGETLAGQAQVTAVYDTAPTIDIVGNNATTVTLNCNGVNLSDNANNPTSFWIVLPPVTLSKGFTVTVTDTNGIKYIEKSNRSHTIERNTILPMAPIEITNMPRIGKPLPLWSEGYLDIHFINSGRGECHFYILPDETTLLVDAGEINESYNPNSTSGDAAVAQKPNADMRPYMTYVEYIKHFIPSNRTSVNWCLASHFHIDHIGHPNIATETSPEGYRKAGLIALHDHIQLYRVLDRAYPDYTENSTTPAMEGALAEDWAKFIKSQEGNTIGKGYRFTPGKEQITLRYHKTDYPNFRIFNICANGYVWQKDSSGNGYLGGSKSGSGNPASCGFHLSYGKFDYIACGDLTSKPQNLVANYFKDFIGKNKLEVFKAHHHFSSNSWGDNTQSVGCNPQVIVNQNFYKKQPDANLLNTVLNFSWKKDFFTTNLHPQCLVENNNIYSRLAGYNGHIVVRVSPGGEQFYVYILDDTNFEYKIRSIHGPYTCK